MLSSTTPTFSGRTCETVFDVVSSCGRGFLGYYTARCTERVIISIIQRARAGTVGFILRSIIFPQINMVKDDSSTARHISILLLLLDIQ